ncbi:neprilysin-4 [Cephus cinctus]|uniref:Neprilysin-4 n=1 Tax=Cephus cinctus TaxID=211228 RepID=A0AAJ7FML8_CEPCN|nr:neprilysin-4 [Cephus cinctus]
MCTEMLLLHAIIVLGAFITGSTTNSHPWIVEKIPDDLPWIFGKFRTKNLSQEMGNAKVCQTEDCRLTGQKFLRSLNKSVDPCEDFYEYACGGWRANNPIPATEPSWDQFRIVEEMNEERIRGILEEPKMDSDILPVRAAKQLYKSCMNLDAIEKSGIKPLEIILEENGGWPMVMRAWEWNSNRISWQQIQDNYSRLSEEATLYSLAVSTDLKNANVHLLTLDQPDFTLPRSMLVEREQYQEQIMAYAKYIEEVAVAFAESRRLDVNSKAISEDVADVINFEIELAKIASPDEMRRDVDRMYNHITIRRLQKWYNKALPKSRKAKINWLKTIQNLFTEANIQVEITEKILVIEMEYIFKLVNVLEKTSERTIVNYLHWRFVSNMLSYTNEKMRNINFAVIKNFSGIIEQKPRWQTCVSENQLSHAVSYQFVQKYFPEESKRTAMEMVKEIEDELDIQISRSDWMDNETKSAAKEKLRSMTEFIGFPDWYKNVSAILHYYKGMKVGPSYFDNVLNYIKFSLRKSLRNLREPVDKTEWTVAPITVNAFYKFSGNSLTFPAAILQIPFFSASQPNAINYGSIGSVIGHEISHGFDDIGRQFDKNGNAIQWWSDATIKAYNERAECFVDQFNKYQIKELQKVNDTIFANGELTQGENIADTTGLQAVYEAYQTKLAADGITEDRLPGLEDFNNQQIFFLSYANTWCESIRPELLLYSVKTDTHSTSRLRVIGSVSNTQGFSEAFQCPRGSRMNPENRCNLWQ